MNDDLIAQLNKFMGRASKATYASGGGKVDKPHRNGFKELEYSEDDWYYRDSYTGFLRSWGQEIIWYKNEPVWTCLYGGGMHEKYMDSIHANQTFAFLKKALSVGEKETSFQPRGPHVFEDGEWTYICEVFGDIKKFHGNETITNEGVTFFTHDFFGGLAIN